IQDQRDQSGLLFRRNRYYDPATGQFMQHDPIGIAGGMNLYGFANGDPVNFSDPFGLSACPPDCSSSDYAWMAVGGTIGFFIGGGGGSGFALATGGAGAVAVPAAGAAGATAGAAAGLAISELIDSGIHMFSRRSRAIDTAEGQVGQIERHLQVMGRDPSHRGVGPQITETRAFMDTVRRQLRHMGRRTAREWQARLDDWQSQLDDIIRARGGS
ncbi:MAG: RHS repeat-associated core domain-containing protein, partial [Phycisphaerales bacterium]